MVVLFKNPCSFKFRLLIFHTRSGDIYHFSPFIFFYTSLAVFFLFVMPPYYFVKMFSLCSIWAVPGLNSSWNWISFLQGDVLEDNEKDFYDSDEEQKEKADKRKRPYAMDPDHRLLIRNTKPLLQSRNAAVCKNHYKKQFTAF